MKRAPRRRSESLDITKPLSTDSLNDNNIVISPQVAETIEVADMVEVPYSKSAISQNCDICGKDRPLRAGLCGPCASLPKITRNTGFVCDECGQPRTPTSKTGKCITCYSKNRISGRKKIIVEPDDLRNALEFHSSWDEVSHQLGMSPSTLKKRMDEDPELREIWDARIVVELAAPQDKQTECPDCGKPKLVTSKKCRECWRLDIISLPPLDRPDLWAKKAPKQEKSVKPELELVKPSAESDTRPEFAYCGLCGKPSAEGICGPCQEPFAPRSTDYLQIPKDKVLTWLLNEIVTAAPDQDTRVTLYANLGEYVMTDFLEQLGGAVNRT
jgi:hypothetical protein